MDDFNLEKLAKEIVVQRLKGLDDPPAGAGEVARQMVVKAIAGTLARQTPRETVHAVCRGLVGGMLILEKDLPRTAVAILGQMSAAAVQTHQDPAELMTWAMEGIAPVVKLAGAPASAAVEDAIEGAFMGAGRIYADARDAAGT